MAVGRSLYWLVLPVVGLVIGCRPGPIPPAAVTPSPAATAPRLKARNTVVRSTGGQPTGPVERIERQSAILSPSTGDLKIGQAGLPQLNELKQVDNGPGVVICEPVSRNATKEAGELGAGCSRWLQLFVAGQPEFGKTNLFFALGQIAEEMGRKDLRITRREARTLAWRLGATHAVVSEVSGNGASCALTYTVVAVDSGQTVREPVRIVGSPTQIVSALPKAARQLCAALGAPSPGYIPVPQDTPADLRLAGRLPWPPDERISRADLDAMDEGQRRSALLTLLLLINRGQVQEFSLVGDIGENLIAKAPGNPMALAELARVSSFAGAERARSFEDRIRKRLKETPNHYLWNAALVYSLRQDEEYPQAVEAAGQAVRCSIRSPMAWRLLESTLARWDAFIRKGRVAAELTDDDLQLEHELAVASLAILRKAQQIDRDARVYVNISSWAAFAGDARLADESFWKAVRQAPDDPSTLEWGLQLYHPKWLDDRPKAARVVGLAVSAAHRAGPAWSEWNRINVGGRCYLLGFRKEALRIAGSKKVCAQVVEWADARKPEMVTQR